MRQYRWTRARRSASPLLVTRPLSLRRKAAGRDKAAGHDLTFSTSTDQNLIDPHLMPISCVTLSFRRINTAYYYSPFFE